MARSPRLAKCESLSLAGEPLEFQLSPGTPLTVAVHRPRILVLDRRYTLCDHDSAFLVPAPWTDSRHPLAAIVHATTSLLNQPSLRLLVIGRASASGSTAHNQALSEGRADGVRALLEGDAAAWVEIVVEHGSLRDVLAYLQYLGHRRGWSCPADLDVSASSHEPTPEANRAIELFQGDYNERFESELLVDGVCGKNTLAAVFDVLRFELERWLDKRGASPDDLPLDRVIYRGYGNKLTTAPNQSASTDADHRLVDLLLVETVADETEFDLGIVYTGALVERLDMPLPDEPDDWTTGPFTIVTDLTPDEPAEPETYRLSSEDGTLVDERVVPDDAIVEAGELVLKYPTLPTGLSYRLTVTNSEGDEALVFAGVPYGALHQAPGEDA